MNRTTDHSDQLDERCQEVTCICNRAEKLRGDYNDEQRLDALMEEADRDDARLQFAEEES
jgi:hypothetical protein